MQKMTKEEQQKQTIIDEYEFNSQQRNQKIEEHKKEAIAALQPLIQDNLTYLRYAQAKGYFAMTKEEEISTATHNALISVIGQVFKWEPYDAEKMAVEVLEDVNLHELAKKVSEVLGVE